MDKFYNMRLTKYNSLHCDQQGPHKKSKQQASSAFRHYKIKQPWNKNGAFLEQLND